MFATTSIFGSKGGFDDKARCLTVPGFTVIFDDHHFGTSMPSGGHPPHQLATSFITDFAGVGFNHHARNWSGVRKGTENAA